MTINKTQDNGKIILALEGRLDTSTALKLQEELLPTFEESKVIELDFEKLIYVSSAGLRVLLTGQKTAKAKDAAMIVCNVSEEIMEVFEMTGFSGVLEIR